jgi:hypothetical protein
VSYPQGPWPPYGYGFPQAPPEEDLGPPNNRNLIMLLAIGLPLLLLSAMGALYLVFTDQGRSEGGAAPLETQIVEESPPDVQLNLTPPSASQNP